MTTGRYPLMVPSSISPIALVNEYTLGNPKYLALQFKTALLSLK
jgi:hypothetical protein